MEIQWSLLFFSLLAGTGGSLMAIVGFSQVKGFGEKARKWLLIGALALIVVGGLCSVLHLEQKANIMAAAANIFSFSPISMELIMVGICVVIGLIYLVAVIKGAGALSLKVVGVLGIVFGLLLGYVTGSGYQMGAQPDWNTFLLPLCYLATDAALAAAIYALVLWGMKCLEEAGKMPLYLMLITAIVALVLCLVYGFFTMFGDQPLLFWLGVIVLGTLCNSVCSYLLFAKKVEPMLLGLNVAFALCAAICLRAFMWLIGTGTLALFDMAAMHMHY